MRAIEEIDTREKKDNIIDGIMKSKGLYCLVSNAKVGKSMFSLQLSNSIINGTQFLGHDTMPSPVLYISTESDFGQIQDRIKTLGLTFPKDSFFVIDRDGKGEVSIFDFEVDLMEFSKYKNGKLVIIDMLYGIDMNNGYDINNYQDTGQYLIPKFRELCQKYNFTILLIHHLNKSNTSLGSTAIDGSVDGMLILKEDTHIKNKIILEYESRDYEGFELILKKNENLIFERSETEIEDLDYNLTVFLNYAIKQKEFTFTVSEITSKLNLNITPSVFGKLLNNNLSTLEKEGLSITMKRTSIERTYFAKYQEPLD